MNQTHEVTLPMSVAEVWALLDDPERLAAAMPGATLERADGNVLEGSVRVRLGPMSLVYGGIATVTERNHESHELRISAAGTEQRGAGTANADVLIRVLPDGNQAKMSVETEFTLTGRPAQLGGGIVQSVAGRLFQEFAERLGADVGGAPMDGDGSPDSPPDAIDLTLPLLVAVGAIVGVVGVIVLIIRLRRSPR